jgi:DNA-directed RNA polymerase subunit L
LIVKVVSIADNAVQIQIDKEDYSIADIVHRELLNVKHVKFAGVPPPHPLIKTLTVQVHTDGASPMKLVNEALDLAKDQVAELLKETNDAFPRALRKARSTDIGPSAPSERSSSRPNHSGANGSSEKRPSIDDAEVATSSSP